MGLDRSMAAINAPAIIPRKEISSSDIKLRVERMAAKMQVPSVPGLGPLFCVVVLKGGFYFGHDFLRALDRDIILIPAMASSYGERMQSSGRVHLQMESTSQAQGRDVLVLDDIYDTGLTIAQVLSALNVWPPRSIHVSVLMNKQPRKPRLPLKATFDYGFQAQPDRFYFGYGMDLQEHRRNFPDIWSIPKVEA